MVPADGVLGFLHPLPVAALWGVGERTGQVLARLGLRTVGDIAQIPVATLQRELGQRPAPTWPRWPGAAMSARWSAGSRRRASGRRRRSPVTSMTPR